VTIFHSPLLNIYFAAVFTLLQEQYQVPQTQTTDMASNVQVHVINKTDSSENHIVTTDLSLLPPLAPNNIRLQVRMCSLTANNLTYARLAAAANWWDAFPVPNFLPSPYNDENIYGIVPVWGYAEILSTRIEGLKPGSILYGFWPSSTLPIDLELEPTEPAGHYIDKTPHRQTMWSYYHRYILMNQPLDLTSPTLASELIFKPLFECSHSLNAHVLGPLALHPSKPQPSTPKPSSSYSDLSKTTIISLSAAGKTARAFTDAVLNARAPPDFQPPQAYIAITSNPSNLNLPVPPRSPTKTAVYSYAQALEPPTLPTFVTSLSPPCARIIIVDFGARDNSLPPLLSLLRSFLASSSVTIEVIGVGAEPLPAATYSPEQFLQGMAAVPERVQMNTSVVREEAIKAIGAKGYFEGVEEGWKGFVGRGGCVGAGGRVEVGRGVGAFGEGWGRLCRGGADVGGMSFVF